MSRFFNEYADRLERVVNTGDLTGYMSDGDWANDEMRYLLGQLGNGYVLYVANKYAPRLTETGDALIHEATRRADTPSKPGR